MSSNQSNILDSHHRWLEAEIHQDVEAMKDLLHDEVICLLPGGTRITEKQDLLNLIGGDAPKIKRIDISNMWLKLDSRLAVKVADFETHFYDDQIPVVSGTHTWCLKKEREDWKIQMITWTLKGESGKGERLTPPPHTTGHTGP